MIKLFEEYIQDSSKADEHHIIETILIPFVLKKHEQLLKWAENKFNKGSSITAVQFKKYSHKPNWIVVVEAMGWSHRESNLKIQYIFTDEVKKYANKFGIIVDSVHYAGVSSYEDAEKYVVYNVETKSIDKK
jgi:hypothetical protein